MLCMTLIPMLILGCIIVTVTANRFNKALNTEISKALEDICGITLRTYDLMYPGDFNLIGEDEYVFVKGNSILNNQYEIIDNIKEQTGMDISIFYYDTRVLTTIHNEQGERIVGTGCSTVVFQQVYQRRRPKFYPKVDIFGTQYFSYYTPMYNSNGNIIGMIFAGRPAESVKKQIAMSMLPIVLLEVVGTIIVLWICTTWTGTLITHLMVMKDFLKGMTDGKLDGDIDLLITRRGDEVGEMARAMLHMQTAVRNLVEKDTLTGLRNRRYGNIKLSEVQKKAESRDGEFAVAIGDVDFFKKINDTYGHECGDVVLKTVSDTLARGLRGRGFAARWGGEEFLMVFQYVNGEEAEIILNAIRNDIKILSIPYEDKIVRLTMSFGVIDGRCNCSIDELIRGADENLYYAKTHGRNRVVRVIPEEDSDAVE